LRLGRCLALQSGKIRALRQALHRFSHCAAWVCCEKRVAVAAGEGARAASERDCKAPRKAPWSAFAWSTAVMPALQPRPMDSAWNPQFVVGQRTSTPPHCVVEGIGIVSISFHLTRLFWQCAGRSGSNLPLRPSYCGTPAEREPAGLHQGLLSSRPEALRNNLHRETWSR
jgi:hypothetical protein